jgi:hypothetical protein
VSLPVSIRRRAHAEVDFDAAKDAGVLQRLHQLDGVAAGRWCVKCVCVCEVCV